MSRERELELENAALKQQVKGRMRATTKAEAENRATDLGRQLHAAHAKYERLEAKYKTLLKNKKAWGF